MIRFPKCVTRKLPHLFAIVASSLLFAGGAHATAMFSSSATVSLTVTGVDNVTTPGGTIDIEILGGVAEAEPFGPPLPPEIYTEGTGTGSATAVLSPPLTPPFFGDPTVLGIGDGLSISLTGSGSADPSGYADVIAIATAFLTIDNFSLTEDVEVSFMLDISLAATASVDDPILEDALGDASIFFDAFSGTGPLVDEFIEADALFGPPGDSFDLSLSFSLIIGAEESDAILMVADVAGFAEAVPAPGSVIFLIAGTLVLAVRRRVIAHA